MYVFLSVITWIAATLAIVRLGSFQAHDRMAGRPLFLVQFALAVFTIVFLTTFLVLGIGSEYIVFNTVAWFWAGISLLVYAATWGLCQTILLWRRNRKLRHLLAAAEIRRLRTQINPHFLYNTLNAISELGYDDPKTADRVITQLSGLLRKALDDSNRQEIALRDEIAFLERYLDIQKVLLRDRLHPTVVIEDRALSARLPGMIVQPLVENALTHGIGADGVAHVRIAARRDGDMLTVEVTDEGPGLPQGAGGQTNGIGLANIRARLEQLYATQAALTLRNREDRGLMARLTIPFHEGYAYDETARPDR